MIKKIMTGLAVATTTLILSFGTPAFNQTTVTAGAAGNVLSMEEAAKKLIKTAYKSHDQKKKLSATVTIKCPNKKSVEKYENELSKAVAKEELGEFYDVESFRHTSRYRIHTRQKDGTYMLYDTYKDGKLSLKVTYNGKDKDWRSINEMIIYGKQNVGELREVTEGMSEKDKAWRIAVWLMVDHKTKYRGVRSEVADSDKDVANNRAQGLCDNLADLYGRYASRMGLTVGYVRANDHRSNCVVIDDKLYYLDMQDISVNHFDWISSQNKDYNDEDVDKTALVKYVPDPAGRWLKVPQGYAEEMETGYITKYPWEASEGEWCLMTEKQAKVTLRLLLGKPSKWKYSDNIKKYL